MTRKGEQLREALQAASRAYLDTFTSFTNNWGATAGEVMAATEAFALAGKNMRDHDATVADLATVSDDELEAAADIFGCLSW